MPEPVEPDAVAGLPPPAVNGGFGYARDLGGFADRNQAPGVHFSRQLNVGSLPHFFLDFPAWVVDTCREWHGGPH